MIKPNVEFTTLTDGAVVKINRGRKTEQRLRLGPNHVHACITHPDGSYEDLGISENLLTTVGRDLWANAFGHSPMKEGVVTASSATSATPSGGGMTVDQYKGWRVYMPVTGLTTAPVYGNIGTNSATVLTVDQWWNATDTAATTPASTSGYQIMATCVPRFMGITTDAAAAAAGDTVLASEITTGGCTRALTVFAHTAASATYTSVKAYAVGATFTAIHKMGLFTALNTTAGGVMVFETVLNQDATVGSGDTLTVTDTVTLSG
jgi:hypothetical protein